MLPLRKPNERNPKNPGRVLGGELGGELAAKTLSVGLKQNRLSSQSQRGGSKNRAEHSSSGRAPQAAGAEEGEDAQSEQ